jgi:peptidoglycan/xylan/chitin deacetylase (PgdA/CDA1 family)
LVVSYHYVRDGSAAPFQGLHGLGADRFEQQLAGMQHDRALLDYTAFLDALDGRRPLATPGVLLTFDDGLSDHYTTVFPILKARGAAGIFFVSARTVGPPPRVLNVQKTQLLLAAIGSGALWEEVLGAVVAVRGWAPCHAFGPELYRYDTIADARIKHLLNYELPFEVVDPVLDALFRRHIGEEAEVGPALYLSEAMIREMARSGMTFGYHTATHRVLARLSEDEQRAEIEDGVRWIRTLTGQASVPFCYPHGHAHAYTTQTMRILRETGYSMAFTAVRGLSCPAAGARFELPRYDTRDMPLPAEQTALPGPTAPRPSSRSEAARRHRAELRSAFTGLRGSHPRMS